MNLITRLFVLLLLRQTKLRMAQSQRREEIKDTKKQLKIPRKQRPVLDQETQIPRIQPKKPKQRVLMDHNEKILSQTRLDRWLIQVLRKLKLLPLLRNENNPNKRLPNLIPLIQQPPIAS